MAPIGIDDDQLEVMRREAQAATFHSEEARRDFERARRRRVVFFVLGGCLLVCWSLFMVWLGRGTRPTADAPEIQEGGAGTLDIDPVGSPVAKLKVLCVLPGGADCHSAVIRLFTAAARKRPREIRVEFEDMHLLGEEEVTKQIGSYCAAIAINGKTSFEVHEGGKTRGISLVGTVPTHYSVADVVEALTHEYAALYGDPGGPLVDEKLVASLAAAPEHQHYTEHDEEEEIELPLSGQLKLLPE